MSYFGRGHSAVAEFWRLFLEGNPEAAWLRVEEVSDTGGGVLVRLELPGIDPHRDVVLSVTNGVLHVIARRTRMQGEPQSPNRSEFNYGSFSRHVALPSRADEEAATATYRDGILEVRVPVGTDGREAPKLRRTGGKIAVGIPVSRP
jgi:HSP20 family protein